MAGSSSAETVDTSDLDFCIVELAPAARLSSKAACKGRGDLHLQHARFVMHKSLSNSISHLVSTSVIKNIIERKLTFRPDLTFRYHRRSCGSARLSQQGGVTSSDTSLAQTPAQPNSIWHFLKSQRATSSEHALSEEIAKDLQQSRGQKPRSGISSRPSILLQQFKQT